jgi:hypothetical protein
MRSFLTLPLLTVMALTITALVLPTISVAQKPLAPGVLQTIPSNLDPRDSFSLPMPLPQLEVQPYETEFIPQNETLHRMSRRVIMFRDVWEYELSFLGQLRQAKLVVPDLKTGTTKTKNVWYLIYRVRDLGKTLTYDLVKQTPEFEHIKHELKRDQPIPQEERFFLPRFTLEGWIMSDPKAGYQRVVYHDKVSPMVLRQIQRREDPSLKLLDALTMSKTKIPLAKNEADAGVWGVAVFENVDPRLDYVSVFVAGLTNAFRIGNTPKSPNRIKTLQLNFWRPGDVLAEEIDRINYGIPLVDNPQEQILITKRYDLPGPLLRGYYTNPDAADLNVLITEVDAKVSLKTFRSAVAPQLDAGKIPAEVVKAFAGAGYPIEAQSALTTVVPGKRWTFTSGEDRYILALEPQYWERKNDKSIRFIKSLDHLWIYR